MASWNREQGSTLKFLANNFDDPRWRKAALKNAYALLSKRRFGEALTNNPPCLRDDGRTDTDQHMRRHSSFSQVIWREQLTSACTNFMICNSPSP